MEPSRSEVFRQGTATLALAIVAAAAIVGFSLPDAPRPPKYQAFVVDGKIVRLDTREGHLVACDFNRCVRVLGNGKKLAPNSAPGLAPAPAAPALAAPRAPAEAP